MTVINTNTSAIITANALSKNDRALNEALERSHIAGTEYKYRGRRRRWIGHIKPNDV